MKYSLLFFFFSMFILRGGAQVTLTLTPINQTVAVNPDSQLVIAKAQIQNTSNQTKKFTWLRTIVSNSGTWKTQICDKNACWAADRNTPTDPFELAPNAKSNLDVYVTPDKKSGTAVVEVKVVEVGNDANTITAKYTLSSSPTRTKENADVQIRAYPNPATDYFQITDPTDVVDKVLIYNIIGRQMRVFKASDGGRYNVNDLPDGLYIVRLQNTSGATVKTFRLSKVKIKA